MKRSSTCYTFHDLIFLLLQWIDIHRICGLVKIRKNHVAFVVVVIFDIDLRLNVVGVVIFDIDLCLNVNLSHRLGFLCYFHDLFGFVCRELIVY